MGVFRSWVVAIVGMWFLSPLGGQAALRCFRLQDNIVHSQVPAIYYLGSNRAKTYIYYWDGAYVFWGGSTAASELSNLRAIMSTSFFAPATLVSHANGSSNDFEDALKGLGGQLQASQLGQQDLWRNVKVPFVQYLPEYDARNPTSWVSVPQDQVVPYASHVGLPIRGGRLKGWKLHHACRERFYYATVPQYQFSDTDETQSLGREIANIRYPNIWFDILNNSAAQEASLFDPPGVPYGPRSRLQLAIGEPCSSSLVDELWNRTRLCDIGISYVEMEVKCTRLTAVTNLICRATRARHAPSLPIEGNLTALSSNMLAWNIMNHFSFTGATLRSSEFSLLERYLRDLPTTFRPAYENSGSFYEGADCNFFPPTDILERRLATALNTMVMASYKTTDLTGGDEVSIDDPDPIWEKRIYG